MPTITAAAIVEVQAAGGPDDMVLMREDGSLELDATPDDIATYQVPHQWPRYVCRVAALTTLLRRRDADAVAVQVNRQMALVFAMDARVPVDPNAPAGNAPVRVGDSAVTITG